MVLPLLVPLRHSFRMLRGSGTHACRPVSLREVLQRCLRDCFRPLTCDLTGPNGCAEETRFADARVSGAGNRYGRRLRLLALQVGVVVNDVVYHAPTSTILRFLRQPCAGQRAGLRRPARLLQHDAAESRPALHPSDGVLRNRAQCVRRSPSSCRRRTYGS